MKNIVRLSSLALAAALAVVVAGCTGCTGGAPAGGEPSPSASSAQAGQGAVAGPGLANGEYTAEFNTDSSMFHVNEANDGKGVLTVTDEGMAIHVSLVSKRIVGVYAGTAEEAEADGAGVIEPTADKVTYSDGYEEEVYGFDVPVPVLDEEFDVAILGEKGTWYDHRVSVSNPVSE